MADLDPNGFPVLNKPAYNPYNKSGSYPNLDSQLERIKEFFSTYIAESAVSAADNNNQSVLQHQEKYRQQLQLIKDQRSNVLTIEIDDLILFDPNSPIVDELLSNVNRAQKLFYKAADELLDDDNNTEQGIKRSSLFDNTVITDVWSTHREQRMSAVLSKLGDPTSTEYKAAKLQFPPELTRRYELHIIPATATPALKLRDINANCVGSLVSVRGIITRVTDVAPLATVVAYTCSTCGYESYQSIKDLKYNPLNTCPSNICKQNENAGRLTPMTRGSKFQKYQTAKLQELHTEVPVGHVPRTLNLRVLGSLTRSLHAGDCVTISGCFLPTPYTGFRAIRAGLTTDTYIEVTHLVPAKKSFAAHTDITPELAAEIETASKDSNIYEQLSQSIAPEIFGHSDIKKALILQLAAGVTRKLPDGMKIRGDINILLMGDPGVAKSQLLKHIAHISPRGVYTTGKGSSGVGLTAAVIRDPNTGDMSLEGGSLVLADMGICCIDEFDKMEEGDRTAIHEVMEQQTVSIAKAGITTTLNARTAVLAAANPVFGRWNKKVSIETNLGLPASLISRFDLTFIILDTAEVNSDTALAAHVTHVHINNTHPPLLFQPFNAQFLRAYIAKARTYNPVIPKELTDYLVGSYVGLRKEDESTSQSISRDPRANQRQKFCTPRSLLSILRLAQGLARLLFRNIVTKLDVEEAIRLISESKSTDNDRTISSNGGSERRGADPISEIYAMIRQYAERTGNSLQIPLHEIRQQAIRRGYSQAQFDDCVNEYTSINVLMQIGQYLAIVNAEAAAAEDY